jgi:very-short-patch-repair endonuclease
VENVRILNKRGNFVPSGIYKRIGKVLMPTRIEYKIRLAMRMFAEPHYCECANNCSQITSYGNRFIPNHHMIGRNKWNNGGVRRAAEKMTGRTKETHDGVKRMSEKKAGRTKENDESVRRTAEKLTGRTKETYVGLQRTSEKLKGRTKENNESVRKRAEKLIGHKPWNKNLTKSIDMRLEKCGRKISITKTGRTKEQYEYLMKASKLRLGQRKETHESIRKISEKLTGRTKENHDGVRRQAEKMRGRTRETHPNLIRTPETKEKHRIATLKRIQKDGGLYCAKGNHETQILDEHETILCMSFERGVILFGYIVDGYNIKHNIICEADENHHFNFDGSYKQRDIDREDYLYSKLGCMFIRIKEKEWLKSKMAMQNEQNSQTMEAR